MIKHTPKEQAVWSIKKQPYFRTLRELHIEIQRIIAKIKHQPICYD